MKYVCPVCFCDGLTEPPYNSREYGLYEICPCCGFQFGYDDYPNKEEQIIKWRQEWISNGCQWRFPKDKPADWEMPEQIKKIIYRDKESDAHNEQ